jgi:hypothetical protein
VVSLIEQFNQKVKETAKFWDKGGAVCVRRIRNAYLSEDDRGRRFHEQRPQGWAAYRLASRKSKRRGKGG